MSKIITEASMSIDGFIAKQDNTIGRLFDWLQNGDVAVVSPAGDITFHLTPPSAEHWRRWTSRLGALVVGRTLFDFVDGWHGRHSLDVPVVVVTHQVPAEWIEAHPYAPFSFVTEGVEAAVTRAQQVAARGKARRRTAGLSPSPPGRGRPSPHREQAELQALPGDGARADEHGSVLVIFDARLVERVVERGPRDQAGGSHMCPRSRLGGSSTQLARPVGPWSICS